MTLPRYRVTLTAAERAKLERLTHAGNERTGSGTYRNTATSWPSR